MIGVAALSLAAFAVCIGISVRAFREGREEVEFEILCSKVKRVKEYTGEEK